MCPVEIYICCMNFRKGKEGGFVSRSDAQRCCRVESLTCFTWGMLCLDLLWPGMDFVVFPVNVECDS
jgi:hypothetical protein